MMIVTVLFVTENELVENTIFKGDTIEIRCDGYVTTVTIIDKKTERNIMFPAERFVFDLIDEKDK